MQGYIKVHRKTMCSSIWQDPEIFRLWMYCLMKASHKEHSVMVDKQEVKLGIGDFVTGRFKLHQEYNNGISPRKQVKDTTLWNWVKKLEKMGNLDIKTYNKYSVISIVNWGEYQETLTTEPQQIDSSLTTEPQQIDTYKNGNKGKNEKKNKYAEFVSMTEKEYNSLVDKYGEDPTKKMIEVLDNYKGSKGKNYKSDYRAILNWVVEKVVSEKPNNVVSFDSKAKEKIELQKRLQIVAEQMDLHYQDDKKFAELDEEFERLKEELKKFG